MDRVIVTGDQAIFDAKFGAAVVAAPPGIITGSSRSTVDGATVCVVGDEASVIVPGASYTTPTFPTPGAGILTIESLADDQQASQASSRRADVILVGSRFRARLQVTLPASNSTSTDVAPSYSGTGSFVTANTRTQGT